MPHICDFWKKFISFRVSINGNVSGLSTSEGSGIFVLCPFGIFIQVLCSQDKVTWVLVQILSPSTGFQEWHKLRIFSTHIPYSVL